MRSRKLLAIGFTSSLAAFLASACATGGDSNGVGTGDGSDAGSGVTPSGGDSGSSSAADSNGGGDSSSSPCMLGVACTSNPGAPCMTGVTECPSSGQTICADSDFATAGTSCSGGNTCDGQGHCGASSSNDGGGGNDASDASDGPSCVAGGVCTSNAGAPCKTGVVQCNGNVASCADNGSAPQGTACGAGKACDGNGNCVSSGNDGGVTCHLVINEVQTGGNASASDEWVEIYNPCASAVSLTGYKLVYRSAAGTTDVTLSALSGSIGANAYLLYGGSAYVGPPSPDGSFSNGLAAAGGGVGLRNASGALVDSVGYGTATNSFVEGTAAAAPPAAQSIGRHPNGADTDQNATDFTVYTTPSPRAANP